MNFRSGWKRCIAAVMLADMAASGLTAYAETAQPGTATLDTAAQDAPAVAMYAAPRGSEHEIASIDFSSITDNTLPEGWSLANGAAIKADSADSTSKALAINTVIAASNRSGEGSYSNYAPLFPWCRCTFSCSSFRHFVNFAIFSSR